MMFQKIPTKEVKDIARLIGYRKKTVCVKPATEHTMHGVNWSGGSRTQYTMVDLRTMKALTPDLGRPPPWANPAEGAKVEIPPDCVLIAHGIFCGKPATAFMYVHPDSMPRMLGYEQS